MLGWALFFVEACMSELNDIPSLTEDELNPLGVLLEDEAERQDSFDFLLFTASLPRWLQALTTRRQAGL